MKCGATLDMFTHKIQCEYPPGHAGSHIKREQVFVWIKELKQCIWDGTYCVIKWRSKCGNTDSPSSS